MFQTTAKKAMFLAIAGVVSATAVVNCSSDKDNKSVPATGVLSMALKLSNGVNVNTVDYSISGGVPPLAAPIVGSVDVSDPGATLTFFVGGIPAGTGYVMDLAAKSTDGKTTCGGQVIFAVEAGKTTAASVQLQCRADATLGGVAITASTNNCPAITSQVVAPQAVSVGGKISVGATAADLDAADTLVFAWSGGNFDAPAAASTKFTCTSGGVKTLTVSVTDSKCTTTASVDVNCVALSCGNGTLEPALGEQCEPPGLVTNGVSCNADCQIIPVCGNGMLEAGEGCDPPNATSGGDNTCSATCQVIPVVCGNNLVQPGEQCDPPGSAVAGGGVCTASCKFPKVPVCGDGEVDENEECDAGPAGSATCTTNCKTIDLCSACEATSCDANTAGCGLYTGARKEACEAWVACIRTTKCSAGGTDPQKCYCGTRSDSQCLGGNGNGACKAQAEAAAELEPCTAAEIADETCAERQATDVGVRFRDPGFPIGGGTNLIFCDGASCSAQCTL